MCASSTHTLRTGDVVLYTTTTTTNTLPSWATRRLSATSARFAANGVCARLAADGWWQSVTDEATRWVRALVSSSTPAHGWTPTHVGIVLRDPVFIDPHLRGLYLWHASDPHQPQLELVPLAEFLARRDVEAWVRPWMGRPEDLDAFRATFATVYPTVREALVSTATFVEGAPHAPDPTHIHWSAAFLGYVCVATGRLDPIRTAWHLMHPSDFAQPTERLWYANSALDLNDPSASFVGAIASEYHVIVRGGCLLGRAHRVQMAGA